MLAFEAAHVLHGVDAHVAADLRGRRRAAAVLRGGREAQAATRVDVEANVMKLHHPAANGYRRAQVELNVLARVSQSIPLQGFFSWLSYSGDTSC